MVPRKGYNFRFSEKEMAELDEVVRYFAGREDFRYYMRGVTRTDILKLLIKRQIAAIESEAADKAKSDARLRAAETLVKPSKKKAVKK
jgi:hypothetical protein